MIRRERPIAHATKAVIHGTTTMPTLWGELGE